MGAICERVVGDVLDPERLSGLVEIGVDEISWRRNHKYLTLVSDHDTSTIVWGSPGKDTATLQKFFTDLPEGAAERIEAGRWTWDPPTPRPCAKARWAR